jgi:hypothetical protein
MALSKSAMLAIGLLAIGAVGLAASQAGGGEGVSGGTTQRFGRILGSTPAAAATGAAPSIINIPPEPAVMFPQPESGESFLKYILKPPEQAFEPKKQVSYGGGGVGSLTTIFVGEGDSVLGYASQTMGGEYFIPTTGQMAGIPQGYTPAEGAVPTSKKDGVIAGAGGGAGAGAGATGVEAAAAVHFGGGTPAQVHKALFGA